MSRGKEHYKSNIYENAYATFFVATSTAMMEYPYVVGRTDEKSKTLASQAEEYILDSAIGDPSVGNEEVLDYAHDVGADTVVCADVMHNPEETTENIVEMLRLMDRRDSPFDVMVPLQFSGEGGVRHEDHYEMVRRRLSDAGFDLSDYRLLLGGMNKKSPREQIARVIECREHVGEDAYIHALGVGCSREWVVTIRRCPWLLDSFDNSTIPQSLVYSGELLNGEMEWVDFPRPRGTNSTVVYTQYIESSLDLFNYLIGSDIDERDAITEFEDPTSSLANRVRDHVAWHGGNSFESLGETSVAQ